MDGINTVVIVPVLKSQKQLRIQPKVHQHLLQSQQLQILLNALNNGLGTTYVMTNTIILNVNLVEVIAVKKILKRDGINSVMNAHVLKFQKQQKHLLNALKNGLGTTYVMTITIILNVNLMEVIVVKTNLQMDGINTVMNAYVLKFQKQLELLLIVLINGLVTITVMMETIMRIVNSMEVIVVKKYLQMDGITIAVIAYVYQFQKQLKSQLKGQLKSQLNSQLNSQLKSQL